ncbi:unnamed protein product [Clonostachys rosea]|uniref:AB hydrolase-1 domain-containing protein n=1 Tax=Bionectria ochroleuca TaxID=29856 RepID=A0ABY6TWY9_BIOOC|nr:unnamed protein product [Clonostachys rosea]
MKYFTLLSGFILSTFAGIRNVQAEEQDDHPILLLNEDSTFHFEILGGLGQALTGGGDISPILGAAKNVTPGDFDKFTNIFYRLANETKAQALKPSNAYDPINVRDTWFSAASYFRRADSFTHGDWEDPLINHLWEEMLSAFDKAISSLPVPGQRVKIPADNFTVEAIWYSAPSGGKRKKQPTLILGGGYDGAQEDMYHTIVTNALARGCNALTYEGPGQPTVRRNQSLGFIPNWERVLTPTIDWLLANKGAEVDTKRLALYGHSMGGYLAARAGAFEPRVKAILLNGGIFDVHESYLDQSPPVLIDLYKSGQKDAFDETAFSMLSNPNYTLKDAIGRIKVPAWIADAELEGFFLGQPQKVKDALGEKPSLHPFTGTAGYHCQAGVLQELNRAIFAWLHKTLG